ncbi:hypothetical protein [Atopomonas hussainii]|uniref:hypothetical protein n=1 Tax=Atopomonas hussainii TaxID=1429083 RepID=UPI0009002C09|nr:hypothetical protein [Atopomonas hussainii]
MNRYLLRGLVFLFALLQLIGCSTVSSLSEETFTFQGKLPKGFGMEAQAHYYSLEDGCALSNWDLIKEFSTEKLFSSNEGQYQFQVPVRYRVNGCVVQLSRVGLYIYGRYGKADWQYSRDLGGIYVVEQLPEGSLSFDNKGILRKQAHCEWLFKLSTARSRLGNVSKLLSCKNDGAYLSVNDLVGKIVEIDFSDTGIERPFLDGYWKKVGNGWRPCTGRWGTKFEELCIEPPRFIPFKMEGRECVIYPGCTE